MAIKYQKARFLIAGSLVAAVVGGTSYFAGSVSSAPAASQSTVSAQAAAPAVTTSRTTTIKSTVKTTRGS